MEILSASRRYMYTKTAECRVVERELYTNDYKKYLHCSYLLKSDFFQRIYKQVFFKRNASEYNTSNFRLSSSTKFCQR